MLGSRVSNATRARPCSMSSASATRTIPRLERQRDAALAVADDRVHHLGRDDRPLGLLVDAGEQPSRQSAARKRLYSS